MKKILYFDVETTGLNPTVNEITQFACVLQIGSIESYKVNLFIRPSSVENISLEALKIQGKTIEEVMNYPDRVNLVYHLQKLKKFLNKGEKFIPAGQNSIFDIGFLKSFFKKNIPVEYSEMFEEYNEEYDLLNLTRRCHLKEKNNLQNNKLETICNFFGVEINAHDALSDILATKKCIELTKKYEENEREKEFAGVSPRDVIDFGKNKGMTWGELASTQKGKGYINWYKEKNKHFKMNIELKRLMR